MSAGGPARCGGLRMGSPVGRFIDCGMFLDYGGRIAAAATTAFRGDRAATD